MATAGWFTKAGETKRSAHRKRYFVLDEAENAIKYFVSAGDNGLGKDNKGTISLANTESIACEDPKMIIHNPDRTWELTAEKPGQVEDWGEKLSEITSIPITGRKKINRESMADLMNGLGPAKAKGEDVNQGVSELFADRMEIRSVTLQRASRDARYGVQFSPYEGISDGVLICGVTPGGPGHGVVAVRERVVGINGSSCAGMTYDAAVNLMRKVVGDTWSILKLDVEFRELWGNVAHDYEATNDQEVSLKVGQKIRIISNEENGWRQAKLLAEDGTPQYGWFPATYVDMEPEPEVIRYIPTGDGTAKQVMARDGPFPAIKIWNHGKVTRQVIEERLRNFKGEGNGAFCARQKDKECFSVGIVMPSNEIKFVLFEKAQGTGLWHADKNEVGRSETLAMSVESLLIEMELPVAEAVPKPEQ